MSKKNMANNRQCITQNPTSTPDAIVIDGALSTNTTEMAESFNNYFSTVCKLMSPIFHPTPHISKSI